jgi:hypothetical protein
MNNTTFWTANINGAKIAEFKTLTEACEAAMRAAFRGTTRDAAMYVGDRKATSAEVLAQLAKEQR